MQAIILAGGKGTRLRPLTVYTPKPIVPVVNRPFLAYQLEALKAAGIKDITLSLSYQPDKIEHLMGDGSEYGVDLRFITEPSPMGTGGAYKFAADPAGSTTVVLNGDILTNIDIAEVVDLHRRNKADATIVLTPVDDPGRYGLVQVAADGRVERFIEKPTAEDLVSLGINTINAGIYVLERAVLDSIEAGQNRSFEYDVFPSILEKGMRFFAYVNSGRYWRDIGTADSYLQAHHDFLSQTIKGFRIDTSRNGTSEIATAASVDKRSVIGADCIIKPNARVINSVLGPGVHIDEKATVENSVIWAHTRVLAGSQVVGSVIGRSCYIGRNSIIGEGAVLGDKASIPDYSRV
jgi:NDP-sugar pyrophosphorylase family protein